MKKLILSMIISGSCLLATAQLPDTSRQQQWNNGTSLDSNRQQQWNGGNPSNTQGQQQWNNGNVYDTSRQQQMNTYFSDSARIDFQPAPGQNAPVITITDSTNVSPLQPMNTDVRNTDPLADTVNLKPATEQLTNDTNTTIIPAMAPATIDSTGSANLNANDSNSAAYPAASAEPVPVQGNMSSVQAAPLPRGVNIPEASTLTTGLGKWSALPVLNTFVPGEVVNKLKNQHGEKLYDITMLKTGENQYAYSARVQENGVYTTVLVNGDTTGVTQ